MKNVINKTGKTGNQTTQNEKGRKNIQYNINKHRPEIREDLDSRENEEQHFKGDDVTHNRKSHRSQKHSIGE
jgi:hypothetical protein